MTKKVDLIVTNLQSAGLEYARDNKIVSPAIVSRPAGLRGLTLNGRRLHLVYAKSGPDTHWDELIAQLHLRTGGRPLEDFVVANVSVEVP
ncbi:hypothetical protein IU451_28730 [Nocardia cyriacigeorgica]|uniref:hypothetical protein n=1 Tax=Nocardia cyriacigeorgica TaxID=135487 RepID=UPI00189396C8|nr:hypothetical protein [Nocardia cyriacigeorgica]MBF6326488.1 hypothetical protein [Nocardia cyriacigeorgica]